jgi:hypothetical protein
MKRIITLFLLVMSSLYTNSQTAKFEPADGKIYHGVGQAWKGETEYMAALNDSTIFPLVRHLYFDIPSTRPDKLKTFYSQLRGRLDTFKSGGFMPEISIAFVGPGAVSTDKEIAQSKHDSIIDSLAIIIKNYGKRVFVRPGFEFNGSWNGYHKYDYVKAFQKIVDKFTSAGIADSCAFIWCYEPSAPNDFDSVDTNGALWYPGNNYVDWFGIDVFNKDQFDQSLPDSSLGVITSKGKTQRFLKMAVQKNKPVHISEATAKNINISSDSLDSNNDWSTWFVPFWNFMTIHPEIKGFNYINWDWTKYPNWSSWGDARINNSSYIVSLYRTEMQKSKYIHLKGSLNNSIHAIIDKDGLTLYQNYPNPASENTKICFSTSHAGNVVIKIIDLSGRESKVVFNQFVNSGEHQLNVNVSDLKPGIYLYRIISQEIVQQRMMEVIR